MLSCFIFISCPIINAIGITAFPLSSIFHQLWLILIEYFKLVIKRGFSMYNFSSLSLSLSFFLSLSLSLSLSLEIQFLHYFGKISGCLFNPSSIEMVERRTTDFSCLFFRRCNFLLDARVRCQGFYNSNSLLNHIHFC